MYLMCAQNMCEQKGKGNATTKVKNDCYDKIENGWDVTKQNQGKPGPGVAVALVVGVPGNPPVPHQVCYCTTV